MLTFYEKNANLARGHPCPYGNDVRRKTAAEKIFSAAVGI
jgi:hypothetical protein